MFRDRVDAGERLAQALRAYRASPDALVLAIPRGGLVVGAVIAECLGLELDLVWTKKIGHPLQPEFAIGVVSLATEIVDEATVRQEGIARSYIDREIQRIRKELRARRDRYQGDRASAPVAGKTAIIVDDGVATGHTMNAAIRTVRKQGAKRIIAAFPVAAPASAAALARLADDVVCLEQPSFFYAIGSHYARFDQVSDDEAIRLLRGLRVPGGR